MDTAIRFSELSDARRLKVGSIIVKEDRIISIGYNGMPAGWDNNCEDTVWTQDGDYTLKTKPEVLHAERNALDKLTKHGKIGAKDGDMFCTHSPCLECAKSIYGAGIKNLYFKHNYRSDDGITFLKKCGVNVEQVTD